MRGLWWGGRGEWDEIGRKKTQNRSKNTDSDFEPRITRAARIRFELVSTEQVTACEGKIQSEDVVGIVTNRAHVYCSHVGLALRTGDGTCHFMHASLTQKKVVVDKTIHEYLNSVKSHAGIVVGRPR